MGTDLNWLSEVGLDTQTGISYTGGEDKYISAVQRFYKNYEKNRKKVEESFSSKDYESFMITVHALKSNAKMIGAMALSGCFEALEDAARNKDISTIEEKTSPTLSDYAALIEKLSPIGQIGDASAADEIPADVAKATAEELLAALDDFDDDLSKRLAKKLSGYPFRITQAGKLKEAIAFIDDFMYDEAADIIKEIAPTIE